MARAGRIAVLFVAALAALATVTAAYGWLYLVRPWPGMPGPLIGDALPLDELPGHAGVPLSAFLAVWIVTALLLGLVVRVTRSERLTAGVLLALGVGGWAYLLTATSILVVRQIPAEDAFRAGAEARAVYIPALLAGFAGALMGRVQVRSRPRAPVVLAWFVAAAGLLTLLDALLPEYSGTLLGHLAPSARPLARGLAGPLGLALVYVAFGLARRRRNAWRLAVGLLGGATALHVLHSDYSAVPTALLALVLVSRRQDFQAPGDPEAGPRLLVRAAIFAACIYGYGALALWVNRFGADQPLTVGFCLRETTRALLGLSLAGSPHLVEGVGSWFGVSVLVLGLAAAALLVHGWLAPWRFRVRQVAQERQRARELVERWGSDTLAPFVLRADKSYFFDEKERAVLAYTVVGGVAIVSGDPIGPPELLSAVLQRFLVFARERDWRVAVLGVSEHWLPLYRDCGLHALYHGDEAVLDVEDFSLEGRPIRKVRQSVHRLERARYAACALRPGEIDLSLRAELEGVARAWRGAEPERGFTMALDELFRVEDAVFVIGAGPDRRAKGFLHFAVCPAARALSLSSMPRLRETPNGFNEWLVCEAVRWARLNGLERISLNFSPFAALLAPEAELSALQRFQAHALRALKGHFQLDNLLLFNRKFFPSWERRFVVYERRRDLPRIGIAALAAEAYLPSLPFVRRASG